MWEWNDATKKQVMIETGQFMQGLSNRRRPIRVVSLIRITGKDRDASNAVPLAYNAGFTDDARIFNTESGHIFGLRLGGFNESENVVPMYAHVNRGLFRQVERDLEQRYVTGQNCGVEYVLTYGDAAEPRLPTVINVRLLKNLVITDLGQYAYAQQVLHTASVRQDPPVITRIAIDPAIQLLFNTARQQVANGWTLETSSYRNDFIGWVAQGGLPAVNQRPYAFLDYIYFETQNPNFPMNAVGTIGKLKEFSEAQRAFIAMANRYSQPNLRLGECWSDAADDPITTALLDLGSDSGIEIDHIMPKSRGGSNAFSNAQVTSRKYNGAKNNTVNNNQDE